MTETRVVESVFTAGKLVSEKTAVIPDEQLAEEAEIIALAKAGILIDNISSLADAKVFLKRLCARLVKKGLLP